MDSVVKYIKKNNIGECVENFDLSQKTTYKTGGKVSVFVEPYDLEALKLLFKFIKKKKLDYFILGNGSNIILPDEFHEIVVIKLNRLNNYVENVNTITVEAGAMMPKLAHDTALGGLSCFEFASGIPGTIGGGVYMNAGAYGVEIKDVIVEATVFDVDKLEFIKLDKDELKLSYRHSIFQEMHNYIVVDATFNYENANPSHILNVIKNRLDKRNETQPVSQASAGSVFKNFEHIGAWKVIDECGLRGFKIGGAQVSEKHCNTIVNVDNATSSDVIALIEHIKKVVKEKMNLEMNVEQRIIKWD